MIYSSQSFGPLSNLMKFKYSPIEDIKNIINTYKRSNFFNKEGIYVIRWSITNHVVLLYKYLTNQLPAPNLDQDYTCYYVSCGTWGAYHLSKNIIYFCPFDLDRLSMTVEELIIHEVKHVENEKKVMHMTHKEKEKYINNK